MDRVVDCAHLGMDGSKQLLLRRRRRPHHVVRGASHLGSAAAEFNAQQRRKSRESRRSQDTCDIIDAEALAMEPNTIKRLLSPDNSQEPEIGKSPWPLAAMAPALTGSAQR